MSMPKDFCTLSLSLTGTLTSGLAHPNPNPYMFRFLSQSGGFKIYLETKSVLLIVQAHLKGGGVGAAVAAKDDNAH